ncbi:tRNA preQ1(34) S-adenosylmethionine ribosyltransferase-isomerase QueA [Candidatus Saccharibacteria bacterium]|nr:tRNA preQ1(34) S-adenosylmethionine ribosyltransferase-isomerase QueA [Candidatus Saccharibacteria bacterium]
MLISEFNYDLPEERIAKYPPNKRGSTRLLVLNRETGALKDSFYKNLDEFLNPGDVLILNDTRVMHARIFCEREDYHPRELVVLENHGDNVQRVMYRGKLHEGDELHVITSGLKNKLRSFNQLNFAARFHDKISLKTYDKIRIKKLMGDGTAIVESDRPLTEIAEKYGTVPLPPYLHRAAKEYDKKRYQTVWAKNTGSAAAPTASLNMTEDLLERLKAKGVIIKYLTLHVGLGTFLPIRTDKVEDHKMHSEWFNIPEDTLEAIKNVQDARKDKTDHDGDNSSAPASRIVAVGTTVARTLEYYAKTGKTTGEDDIFIYPGFEFQIVDALLTNFHAPKSTVLMLASAFAGWDHLHAAYDHAVAEKYNFLSYGDSMFIC